MTSNGQITRTGSLRKWAGAAAATIGLSLSLLGAAGPASAAEADPGDVVAETSTGGWCHYASPWGGTFYCDSNVKIKLPNGYWQAFVIGTDHGVYTQWSSSSGLSGWKLLNNGSCKDPGNHSVDVWDVNGWQFNVTCIGMNGTRYYDHRNSNGSWSGWTTTRRR
ncbi:hypothetical protein ACI1MP_31635 [Kitasatospora griseola]|uniref:hypothetical protein n=1 Tax=Kitasatospora griseola TaxID=2064 RepID=UPI003855C38C